MNWYEIEIEFVFNPTGNYKYSLNARSIASLETFPVSEIRERIDWRAKQSKNEISLGNGMYKKRIGLSTFEKTDIPCSAD